ncbi:MAG: PQQ-binding-like beta-propeller repeat protein [Spirochaetota bacterium]
MKKRIGTLTAVMSILLLLVSGCKKLGKHPNEAMFRANLQRTGVYNTRGVQQLSELKWKFKTEGWVVSSPAIADGVVYFGSVDKNLYAVR